MALFVCYLSFRLYFHVSFELWVCGRLYLKLGPGFDSILVPPLSKSKLPTCTLAMYSPNFRSCYVIQKNSGWVMLLKMIMVWQFRYETQILAEYVTFQLVRIQLHIRANATMFDRDGLLCPNILKVFTNRDIQEIPDKYLHKRWSKEVTTKIPEHLRSWSIFWCSMHEQAKVQCIV